jgi:hypothetical protein
MESDLFYQILSGVAFGVPILAILVYALFFANRKP